MLTDELKREKISILEDNTQVDDIDKFVKDCKNHLGYYEASKELNNIRAKIAINNIFAELKFAPLCRKSVEEYKKKRLYNVYDLLMFLCAIIVLFCTVSLIYLIIALTLSYEISLWLKLSPIFGIASLVTVLCIRDPNDKREKGFSWIRRAVSLYHDAIPRYALQNAIDIKKKIAEKNLVDIINAQFYVEILTKDRQHLDPFLVLRVANEDYYLDVWEEPDFELKREI